MASNEYLAKLMHFLLDAVEGNVLYYDEAWQSRPGWEMGYGIFPNILGVICVPDTFVYPYQTKKHHKRKRPLSPKRSNSNTMVHHCMHSLLYSSLL